VTPVAVTGLGVVSALGPDLPAFTAALRAGRSGVVEVDGRCVAPLAGFSFPDAVAARTGLPADQRAAAVRTARRAPLTVQAGLVAALEAWEHAGLARRAVDPDRVAVVVAGHNLAGQYAHDLHVRDPVHVPPTAALHLLDTDQVGVVSQVLGITGEGCTVGAASASGNAALIAGARLVSTGTADVCLVVGGLTELPPLSRHALTNIGAMAATSPSVPFDQAHAGFVPGEAAACVVLESVGPGLTSILGYAQRLDANSRADPSENGEVAVLTAALRHAGVRPREVHYVNAHGTGSPLGDNTEVRATRRVFGFPGPWVNSTKSITGHCLTAAGVVEAVAVVVQLTGGFLHANAGLRTPVPNCRLVPVYTVPATVRYAASNAFGFGGFSTCVVFGRARNREH
jgi:malonyl-ACP decarboxylase